MTVADMSFVFCVVDVAAAAAGNDGGGGGGVRAGCTNLTTSDLN